MFVVTEVLQTQKEVEVTRTHKQEGLGQFALLGALCLQVGGEDPAMGTAGEAGGECPHADPRHQPLAAPSPTTRNPVLSPHPSLRAKARAT